MKLYDLLLVANDDVRVEIYNPNPHLKGFYETKFNERKIVLSKYKTEEDYGDDWPLIKKALSLEVVEIEGYGDNGFHVLLCAKDRMEDYLEKTRLDVVGDALGLDYDESTGLRRVV